MLLVLVGGTCWKGSGKEKRKGWGVGWKKNPRGEEWLRGQSPRSKVKARFEWPRDQDKAFLCFVLQPSLTSVLLTLQMYTPSLWTLYVLKRLCTQIVSSQGPCNSICIHTLGPDKERGRMVWEPRAVAIVSRGSLIGWNNSQDAQPGRCG